MVKKTTAKTTTSKRTTKATKTSSKRATQARSSNKVDYYPNRMSLAVAALSAVTLLLFGLIAVVNP